MTFRPYLAFNGNAAEAFARYHEIFGGELNVLTMGAMPDGAPPGVDPNLVMHAALVDGDRVLMGADDPTGEFQGTNVGMCCVFDTPDPGEAKRAFDALADGGTIQMELGETFFAQAFGMCTDRFGTPWMVTGGTTG